MNQNELAVMKAGGHAVEKRKTENGQSHDIRCVWACWLWTQAACCQQLASVVLLQAAAGGEITTEYVFSGRGKPHHDIWLSRVRWVACRGVGASREPR